MITDIFDNYRNKVDLFKKSINDIESLSISQEDKDHIKDSIIIAFKEDFRKLDIYKKINSTKEFHVKTIMNAFSEILNIKLTSLTDNDNAIIDFYKNLSIVYAVFKGKEHSFIKGKFKDLLSEYDSQIQDIKTHYSSDIVSVSRYNGKLTTIEREIISKRIYETSVTCISIIQIVLSNDLILQELALCDFDEIEKIKEDFFNERTI